MDESLKIECEWWGSSNGEKDLFQDTRGAIGISVGEQCLTRLEDSWGNTVRSRLHACAYTLAGWFAGNWWRLRWEPETPDSRDDVDWRMSHSIASAGEGFCWPSILFASDWDSIAIASRASRGRVLGPVRYLDNVNTRITARNFERAIDAFMSLVLSRLHAMGHGNSNLAELWNEVLNERGDQKLAQRRRLEAICGFDAGEGPSTIMEMLITDRAGLGCDALEEMAAEGRHSTAELLRPIFDLAASKTKPVIGGFRGKMPKLSIKPSYKADARPWQQASTLAQATRKEWGLGEGPINEKHFAEFFATEPTVFTNQKMGPTLAVPIALKNAANGSFDFYFNSARVTSRRFSAARFLGDYLHQACDGRLIPVTRTKTSRQQFQRAFAQEFLCPFNALVAELPVNRRANEDDIAKVADYFDVSPLMVRTTLVNNGELDRESLAWTD